MNKNKFIVFLGDGMADEPLRKLDGRTPLQQAHTPAMDSIAANGACGSFLSLPEGYPTSSDVANMSVLGCDLSKDYCGRGPLEAAGRNVPVNSNDVVFRLNFVTLNNGIIEDFSAGHLPNDESASLIDYFNEKIGTPGIHFYHGVSYRNLLVLSGDEFSDKVSTEKPDDHQGDPVRMNLPQAADSSADKTVRILTELMTETEELLTNAPVNLARRKKGLSLANGLWPWSGGRPAEMLSFQERYGLRGAVISAVDVINGLGRCLGMTPIRVPGATGYIDTNYEGKAAATLDALRNYDFVYTHVEAVDEVSHEGNLGAKIKAIEDFDSRLIQRVMADLPPATTVAVLPDHPVPVKLRKHTRTPVPFAISGNGIIADDVRVFDEQACLAGRFGQLRGAEFMQALLGK